MGIRESLLNTITSVGNGDFIRIVTSAGASSKATLANVFKSFESGLGAKSSLTTSDYIRVVGSDNNTYKQPVSDVLYAGGVRYKEFATGTAFSDFADSCNIGITFSYNRYPAQSSDAPSTLASERCAVVVYRTTSDEILISAVVFNNASEPTTYVRRRFGSWGNWVKQPTRAEIDASTKLVTPTSIHSSITLQGGYVKFGKIVTVDITVTATSAITVASTNLFMLPAPVGGAAGLLGASPATGKSANMFYVQTQGFARNYYGMAQGESIAITGSYIAE